MPEQRSGLVVAVTGATGNLGTSVVDALVVDPAVSAVRAIARRSPVPTNGRPAWAPARTTFVEADIARDDLVPLFDGVDVVVHLAWQFQPSRDPVQTWDVNVVGAMRVFDAAAAAGVSALVHASSVGAYSPGSKDVRVTEDWPTHGWQGAAYTREKSYLERVLDRVETRNPDLRVVRMRPAFVFEASASTEQRRLFGGPIVPARLVRPAFVPVFPDIADLVFQGVHSRDVGRAFAAAAVREVSGAFNLAADPVITPATFAEILRARLIPLPASAVRLALDALFTARLVPTDPGLFDAVLRLPIMDSGRARDLLEWAPRHTAQDALAEFVRGVHEVEDAPTPPLSA
ncbi:NAD-dependent epimerase/dehydratase family protein [Rhodococcus sp. SORGH_AS_0303]|uniref:NAD-dependent epimerase/dehydratase family protein n=1 Tax=Rhodococcus sp. SORGH_AS_0303 TaxID=3041753 RepID=UPI00278A62B8|nr:NAD-dependent epimerase/dehydratase family protein [Rhodococcus sp. SORGH_AS_0303]MDQ1201054.1 nucleoside-diphosphate-sugar epimerase [Rhodococcus sp. SORGH_AS_0303]